MKMTNKMCAVALLLPYIAFAAAPDVTDVRFVQTEDRLVTVSYLLEGAPAIVTMEAFSNGVRLAGTLLTNATGAVNRRVEPGNVRQKIVWQPRATWPDRKITDGSFSVKLTAWALDNPPDYMAVDLTSQRNRTWYTCVEDIPGGPTNDLYKCDWMLFRRIHAEGVRWRMGENGNTGDRFIPHHVVFTNDYYISIFEMTRGQTARIASGTGGGTFYPDISTTYDGLRGTVATGHNWPTDGHAVASDSLLGKLRTLSGLDGIDLPTSAEWEYASLAGRTALYHWGYSTAQSFFNQYEWNSSMSKPAETNLFFGGDGKYQAQQVGLLKPNRWGLYDTHGNVFERCLDWYATGADYCEAGSEIVGQVGPATGANRVGAQVIYHTGTSARAQAWKRACPEGKSNVTVAGDIPGRIAALAKDGFAGIDRILLLVRTDLSKPDPFIPQSAELKKAMATAHRHSVFVTAFIGGDAGLRPELYVRLAELGADTFGTERPAALFAWIAAR